MNDVQRSIIFHGRWDAIHLTGAWSDTPEKVNYFNGWIRHQIVNLSCEDCVRHSTQYIQMSPPEKADDPFIWTWEFHNAVNRRLGKPEMPYATARDLYLGGKIRTCTKGCGGPTQH